MILGIDIALKGCLAEPARGLRLVHGDATLACLIGEPHFKLRIDVSDLGQGHLLVERQFLQ